VPAVTQDFIVLVTLEKEADTHKFLKRRKKKQHHPPLSRFPELANTVHFWLRQTLAVSIF
jgi:hypothetical protein